MILDTRRLLLSALAVSLLSACSRPPEDGSHPEVSIDEGLAGVIEVVSVERLEPGEKNRLEILVEVRNLSSRSQQLSSALTWLDDSSRKRGGQTLDVSVEANGRTTITAPTNDRQVAAFRMVLSPGVKAADADDPGTLVIAANAVGERATATLAVHARTSGARFEARIPSAHCRDFRFQPGGRCQVSAETPAGSTTTILVSYAATDAKPRLGLLHVDFADPSRQDLEVPLLGRVGARARTSKTITLD